MSQSGDKDEIVRPIDQSILDFLISCGRLLHNMVNIEPFLRLSNIILKLFERFWPVKVGFRLFRQRDKARVGQRSSAYSPKLPSAACGQARRAHVDGQNALRRIARKDAAAFSQRGARAVTGAWPNIENGNRRGSGHTVRARHARM
jgi:hypothetical protein